MKKKSNVSPEENKSLKKLIRRSVKVLDQFPSESIGMDNKPNLHPPMTANPEQERFIEIDTNVHDIVMRTINNRESAKTYWDLNLVKKVVSKKLKKEAGKELQFKITTDDCAGMNFLYVDVKMNKDTEHRHIFRLNPFGYVDNAQIFSNASERYISSENYSWGCKGDVEAIREYYASMKDKSWKE